MLDIRGKADGDGASALACVHLEAHSPLRPALGVQGKTKKSTTIASAATAAAGVSCCGVLCETIQPNHSANEFYHEDVCRLVSIFFLLMLLMLLLMLLSRCGKTSAVGMWNSLLFTPSTLSRALTGELVA